MQVVRPVVRSDAATVIEQLREYAVTVIPLMVQSVPAAGMADLAIEEELTVTVRLEELPASLPGSTRRLLIHDRQYEVRHSDTSELGLEVQLTCRRI